MKKLVFILSILFAVSCSTDKEEIITESATNLQQSSRIIDDIDPGNVGPYWGNLRLPSTGWCGTCIHKIGNCGYYNVLNIFEEEENSIQVGLSYQEGSLHLNYTSETVSLNDIVRQVQEEQCNVDPQEIYNIVKSNIVFDEVLYLNVESTASLVPDAHGRVLMIHPGTYNLSYNANYPFGATQFNVELVDASIISE